MGRKTDPKTGDVRKEYGKRFAWANLLVYDTTLF